jgi:hypothetical protein
MDFNTELNEATKAVENGLLAGHTEEKLRSFLSVLHRHFASQNQSPSIKAKIESVETELSRRQIDKQREGAKTLHDLEMGQGKSFHGETMDELNKLKTSVDRLSRARPVDRGILIAAIAGVIVGIVGLVLAIILSAIHK